MPEAYEAGTVNVHGISALGAGADYIMSFADGEILRHEQKLKKKIIDELSLNERIVLYGGRTDESVGIVSFNVKGYDSQKVADVLAEKGICVRGGFHCAPLAHRTLGTYNTGTVRMSFGIMNTEDEAIKVCKVINNL
jgi:selenocysteine lyase/cysteine desulfurase